MKTSFLIFVICSLLVLIAQAVQIDGYCFLGGQLNHEGTKVLFQADSPGAQTDSTYTDSAGYYQIEISLGVYDIYFSHEDYYGEEILNQFLYIPITLPDITLIHTPIGIPISGPLNGVLEGDTTYFVADNIAVNSDDSLIIEAGATLIFDEGVQFIINGYLHAAGTETDSIKFMGHSGLTWKRITFNNSMNANSILEYCLITDGYAYLGSGGGIMSNNSFLTVTNCMITGNAASYDGGGISVGGSNVLISDCIISGNQTVDGGGIAISSNPTIRNCYIINNTAQGCGGGIYSASSAASIESCIINENIADYGGGVAISNANPQFSDCEIKENTAIYSAGGIYCISFCSPTFINCNIIRNVATNYYGGGIMCYYFADSNLINCIISENTALDQGGGIYCDYNSDPVIMNCTISGNSSGNNGGGIYCYWYSNPNIINTIIEGNYGIFGVYISGSSNPTITYCDIYNNENGNFYNPPSGVGTIVTTNANGDPCDRFGNIFLDPLFYSTTGDSAYYLTAESPCIDAGDPSSPLDPDDTIADIGAFYYDQTVEPLILTITVEGLDVILDWNDEPDAFIYHIYRSEQPYFDITGMNSYADTDTSGFVDYGVVNEGIYFYRVTWE